MHKDTLCFVTKCDEAEGCFLCCIARCVRLIVQNVRYAEYNQTEKEQNMMEHTFVWVKDHVEVYNAMGEFCFSADTKREAWEELRETA